MNLKSNFLLLLIVLPQQVLACTDSTTYEFGQYLYLGDWVPRDCSWITQPTNPTNVENRRNKWCDKTVDGSVVIDECPLACDACPSAAPTNAPTPTPTTPQPTVSLHPTAGPTRPPSPMPSPFPTARPTLPPQVLACTDSTTYEFGQYLYMGDWVPRVCSWITQPTNPTNVANRRETWCDETVDGSLVSDECPLACDACPSAAPTTDPTPTPPTSHPTVSPPTSQPTVSLHPTAGPTRPPSPMPSPFPTARPTSDPTSYPTTYPSSNPTNRPTRSIKPSPSPSASPIDNPSQTPTHHPSPVAEKVIVTNPPTIPPTIKCYDSDLRLTIPTIDKKISRSCAWVANKDTFNRCNLTGVALSCPATCGTCSTCTDPPIRFRFDYKGKNINRACEFVGRKSQLLAERCDASGNICRSTCNKC